MAEAKKSKGKPRGRNVLKKNVSLQEKLSENTLSYYPHYGFPGVNANRIPWTEKWDLENIMGLFKNYPYSCSLPKPLLPPSRNTQCLLTKSDPATDLLFTKFLIEDDAGKILDNFQKHKKEHTTVSKKDLQWKTKDSRDEIILPRYIADLSDILEMDPDPAFIGKYNWYYTGGSITGVTLNGQFILIFPYMNELVAMPLSSNENFTWKPMFKNASKVSCENTIFELRSQTSSCRVLARLKNECMFTWLRESKGEITMLISDSKTSSVPFASADLQPFEANEYSTLDINRHIEVCNLAAKKSIMKADFIPRKNLNDNWGSLRYQYLNGHVLTYADRCCVHHLDTRISIANPVLTMCPKSHLDNCENISLQLFSNRDFRFYLGTYHSFLMCDDRKPDSCVQQKWTHQLKSPPLQGSIAMDGDEEIIIISSQISGDKSIIINNWADYDNPHSFYQPRTPPGILDTLREAQTLGKCLEPLLLSRLKLSTTGIYEHFSEDSNAYIFMQNSIGDVFYQCITHDKTPERMSFINSHSYYALDCWERNILIDDNPMMPLVHSDQVNMEDAVNTFSNKELKYTVPTKNESFLPAYWKQTMQKLSSYVDLLAPELLAAWEIEETETNISSNQRLKVLNWLELADEEDDVDETQEADDNKDEETYSFTPIESQELISVSQQYVEKNSPPMKEPEPEPEIKIEIHQETGSIKDEFKIENQNDFRLEECYLPPVIIKTKPKMIKRKSGFVDGF